jgi:penicillin amidase
LPVPGWTGEYEWQGYIPFDELPRRYNPPEGYLVTANNRIVSDDYPYFISSEYATGNRAQRIVELIAARDRLDVHDMQAMQFDQVSPLARIVARALGELSPEARQLASVVAAMRDWDGRLTPDSVEAAVCQSFVVQMARLMLRDKLGALAERYMGRGPAPVVAGGSLYAQRAQEWLEEQLESPDSTWYDLGGGERREEVMLRALRASLDDLQQRLGDGEWNWGRLHTVTFVHPLGTVEPFASIFNRGPYPAGGDSNTVWATGNCMDGPGQAAQSARHSGSWRTWATYDTPGPSWRRGSPVSPAARSTMIKSRPGSMVNIIPCRMIEQMSNESHSHA